MKVLLVGSGAREHALAWKLNRSKVVEKLVFWPGGPAMASLGETLAYSGSTWNELAQAAKDQQVDFVVVGPEQPLSEGFADHCNRIGIPVFGPEQAAAQLESSKSFSKGVMFRAGIPTAEYKVVTNFDDCRKVATDMLSRTGGTVIKASGLAAGKGVFVCTEKNQIDEGILRLKTSMAEAAETIVVEEILEGRECSFFCMVGNNKATPIGFAVDFKRLKDDDIGPNTGGMGCYTPVAWLPNDASAQVMNLVVNPLLSQLQNEGITYQGYLYVGLMWGDLGPKVVEFNARLGDPEAQVLALHDPRDWGAMIADQLGLKKLSAEDYDADLNSEMSVAVVMAGEGYPYEKPKQAVNPLPENLFANETGDLAIFGASVKEEAGKIFPSSGRVLSVVCKDKSFGKARNRAYNVVHEISKVWPQAQFRNDIGLKVSEN